MKFKKVTKHTRAGKDGKYIVCPHCEGALRVFSFAWTSVSCIYCGEYSPKEQWGLAECQKI